jgi:4-aminobutyrate aminotransferase/(S)-3-amino-2-methylpropionate transaminase
VQTGGGATGSLWAHEAFALPEPPDIVTFSKKMQLGGFYLREDFLPQETYRIFNTFLGDPLRAAQLEVIAQVIERDRLLENVRVTGDFLLSGLWELAARSSGLLSEPRGAGAFAAVDTRDAQARDALVNALRQRGLEAGGSGERSIRFRPALVFAPRHAAEALDIFEAALNALPG